MKSSHLCIHRQVNYRFLWNHSEGRYKGRRLFQVPPSNLRACKLWRVRGWDPLGSPMGRMQHRVAPTLDNEAVLGCDASAEGRLEQSFGFSLCISTSTPLKCSHNYSYAAWLFHEDIFILLVKQQKIPVCLDLWAMVSCCLRNLCVPLPLSFKQKVIGSGCKSLEVKLNHSHQPGIVFSPHQGLWGQPFPSFHNSRSLDS